MENKKIKNTLFIFILTIFFSLVIFLFKSFYLNVEDSVNKNIEEKYIEPVSLESPKESLYEKIVKSQKVKKERKKKKQEKIKPDFSFFPSSFRKNEQAINYKKILEHFFDAKIINEKINFLEVYLYKDKGEVRGRMKNKKILLFGVLFMSEKEFLAVNIHEFGHFLDLYILRKKSNLDLSDIFYNISWKNTTVIKSGQAQADFVSGYSMTNKYEDFAESFTYYILHNKSFLKKAEKSEFLEKKYNFFKNYVFKDKEFINYYDKNTEEIRDYYRDITKIDYDLKSFFHYIKYFSLKGEDKFLEKTFGV